MRFGRHGLRKRFENAAMRYFMHAYEGSELLRDISTQNCVYAFAAGKQHPPSPPPPKILSWLGVPIAWWSVHITLVWKMVDKEMIDAVRLGKEFRSNRE